MIEPADEMLDQYGATYMTARGRGLTVPAAEREALAAALAVAEQHLRAAGYDRAAAVLAGVAARSGSPAARWAADYLTADPDRWRHADRCWHGQDCPGSGPQCEPERRS